MKMKMRRKKRKRNKMKKKCFIESERYCVRELKAAYD
jgi:hypothetical protein